MLLCLPVPGPGSVAVLSRCHIRPTQAQSLLRPLAWAPWSSGYCTAAGKQTKHISHATNATFSQQVILPFPALSVAGI